MEVTGKVNVMLGLIFLLATLLWVGQYYDPQDSDRTLFVKYRPAFKQVFYSPVAYHRYHPTCLTEMEIEEEKAFQEFIVKKQLLNQGVDIPFIPVLLVQSTITFFVSGFFLLFVQKKISWFQLLIHFGVNLVFTTFGLMLAVFDDSVVNSIMCCLVILCVNGGSLLFMNTLFRNSKRLTSMH